MEKEGKVDIWAPLKITREDVKKPFLEVSKFSTLFPKYREAYLQENWAGVTEALAAHGVACELNVLEGSMTVSTTRQAFDPFIIIKARDMIKLLSRSVPLDIARRVLDDGIFCDIIKTKGMVARREVFVKRRQRLVGPEGSTLKALELLTDCYVYIQGATVSALGPIEGLKKVRRVVVQTMKNVHPIYEIKRMMIQRELEKDPALKDENWERFLPQFKKRNVKRKKVVRKKKERTIFPPPQTPSKIDLQIESGEYFLSPEQKRLAAAEEKKKALREKRREKDLERAKRFAVPDEARPEHRQKKRKTEEGSEEDSEEDLKDLKKKLKKRKKK